MTDRPAIRNLIIIAEILAVYAALGYASNELVISRELTYLLLSFAGLIFSLYYGVKGSLAAVCGSAALVAVLFGENFLTFLSQNYLAASFFLAALLIIGFVKSGMESRVIGMSLSNDVLNRRMERLTVELSEKDRALQEAFQEVLTDMESPRIMYQALRRVESVEDRDTLFNEILYILYTHCHVEKSGIFEIMSGKRYRRVAVFGDSDLPDKLAWGGEETPEILRAARLQQEVIVPTRLDNRQAMAIPLISLSERIQYVLLIEEIRFINFNDSLIQLLKVASHWVKYLIEQRLHMEELLTYSVFPSVVVYRPDVGRALMKKNMATHKKFNLPYALIHMKGALTEETATAISRTLRIYDDLFQYDDETLVLFLSMVAPKNVVFVMKRLESAVPDHPFEEIDAEALRHVR